MCKHVLVPSLPLACKAHILNCMLFACKDDPQNARFFIKQNPFQSDQTGKDYCLILLGGSQRPWNVKVVFFQVGSEIVTSGVDSLIDRGECGADKVAMCP